MKSLFLALLLCLVAIGCELPSMPSTNSTLTPEFVYKYDMEITVDGKKYAGIAILPFQPKYEISVKTKGDMNLFTMRTCHREYTEKDKDQGSKSMFFPMPGMEDKGDCPAELAAFEKDKGRHAWGYIFFENPAYTVQATIYCNGFAYPANGVSACQSFFGLAQRISFREKMKISSDAECPMPLSKDGGYSFEYSIVKGACHYTFVDASLKNFFSLSTLGYDKIHYQE